MGINEEREELRRIQEETKRRKQELQRLQEEELRRIRELERMKMQAGEANGYEDDDEYFDVEAFRAAERASKGRSYDYEDYKIDSSDNRKRSPKSNSNINNGNRRRDSGNDRGDGDRGYSNKEKQTRRSDDRDEQVQKNKNRKKKKSPARKFFGFIIWLLIIAIIFVGAFAYLIMNRFERFDSKVAQREGAMKGTQVNILLIGQDAREGESAQRSDTMILCTVNTTNRTVILTSIMRDMYVNIPGYGGNKLNAAFAYGGVNLLDETIEETFGITIDGNAIVDLGGFLEAMVAVGDIEMNLTAEEAEYMNENPAIGTNTDVSDEVWDLHEGVNTLTSSQALCYARMRYVGNSDWDRTERQRKVIMAAISKVKHGHLIGGLKAANGLAPSISTDMTNQGMLKLAFGLLINSEMQSYRLPVDGTYYNDTINGMAVLVPDFEANKSYLKEYMSGEYSEE